MGRTQTGLIGRVHGSEFRQRDRKRYLENVISGFEVSDVDPLAVDVVPVGIPAAHGDTLLPEVSTFVPLFDACNKTLQT